MRNIEDVKFDALRNAIYHTARREFFDRVNKLMNFFVIVLGAAIIGKVGHGYGLTEDGLAFVVTIVATIQLVWDLSARARDHQFLQRRFYEVLSDIEKKGAAALPADFDAVLLSLYGEEGPQMRALDAIAFNAASDSLGRSETLEVTWFQSVTRHLIAHYGASFAPKIKASISSASA